jgi:hypothetical protein
MWAAQNGNGNAHPAGGDIHDIGDIGRTNMTAGGAWSPSSQRGSLAGAAVPRSASALDRTRDPGDDRLGVIGDCLDCVVKFDDGEDLEDGDDDGDEDGDAATDIDADLREGSKTRTRRRMDMGADTDI